MVELWRRMQPSRVERFSPLTDVERISFERSFSPQLFVGIAICLLALIGLLLAGTIVLALIPIYLSNKNIDADTGSCKNRFPLSSHSKRMSWLLHSSVAVLSISGLYASDATDGRSLVLANTGGVSNQVWTAADRTNRRRSSPLPWFQFADKSGLGGSGLRMNAGDFVPLQAASPSGRKRQVVSGSVRRLSIPRIDVLIRSVFFSAAQSLANVQRTWLAISLSLNSVFLTQAIAEDLAVVGAFWRKFKIYFDSVTSRTAFRWISPMERREMSIWSSARSPISVSHLLENEGKERMNRSDQISF